MGVKMVGNGRRRRDRSIPDEESEDFRTKDQPSGVMDAQWGSRSSTGFRNFKPCGPHITSGLRSVSPGVERVSTVDMRTQWPKSKTKASEGGTVEGGQRRQREGM